jgi:hypothetical protein
MKKVKQVISKVVSIALLIGIVPIMTITSDTSSGFVVSNPYADVNWDTFGQYRAALHAHTTNSDGQNSVLSTANYLYNLGFDIVAFAEHDFVSTFPDRTPTGLNPHPSHPRERVPMTTSRIAEMAAGQGRGGSGMIFIPNTNEQSQLRESAIFPRRTHHVNTFWSTLESTNPWPNAAGTTESTASLMGRLSAEGTGFGFFNHLARNTEAAHRLDSGEIVTPEEAAEIMSRAHFVNHYTDIFLNNPFLLGMEINTEFDNETQGSRVLWDNILKQTMPLGRPVWGIAADDSHSNNAAGFAYTYMVMPELSLTATRTAMQTGAMFAFARADREYGIFAGSIEESDHRAGSGNIARVRPVRDMDRPEVERITLSGNTIAITAKNAPVIRWYSDEGHVHTGATYTIPANFSGSFVRASLAHPELGVLYTQPFGISTESGAVETLQSAERPTVNLTFPNGVCLAQIERELPGGTVITTTNTLSPQKPAAIAWDLRNLNFEPGVRYSQTFIINGQIRFPQGVVLPGAGDINLSVSATISVEGRQRFSD